MDSHYAQSLWLAELLPAAEPLKQEAVAAQALRLHHHHLPRLAKPPARVQPLGCGQTPAAETERPGSQAALASGTQQGPVARGHGSGMLHRHGHRAAMFRRAAHRAGKAHSGKCEVMIPSAARHSGLAPQAGTQQKLVRGGKTEGSGMAGCSVVAQPISQHHTAAWSAQSHTHKPPPASVGRACIGMPGRCANDWISLPVTLTADTGLQVQPRAPTNPVSTDLQGPEWQGAGHLWLPHRSQRPHTSSHGGQHPSQQRRLQAWRWQARMPLHRRSQTSGVSHGTSRCIFPHLKDAAQDNKPETC